MTKFVKFDKVDQRLQSLMKFVKLYKVYPKFIWMLPGMICENVCNSLANSDDITKLAAISLTQATLNFQNVYDSLGNNNSFYKNDENSLRFEGNPRESLEENHEKEVTTTKDGPCDPSFLYNDFH